MEKERILLKFVPQVDIAKTDLNAFKGLVTLQYLTEQKNEEIIAYLKSAANVVALIELIGPWHFELECEVASREAELEITRDFQDRFRDVIKEFEIMPLIKEYRNNFFPKDLISRQ